jgi:hypothetical protein
MPSLIPNVSNRRRIISRFRWFRRYIELALERFDLTARNLIWFTGLLHVNRRHRIEIDNNIELVRRTLRDLDDALTELEDDLTVLSDLL